MIDATSFSTSSALLMYFKRVSILYNSTTLSEGILALWGGPHSQDNEEARLRETPAGKSDVGSRDDNVDACSGKHLSGLLSANT